MRSEVMKRKNLWQTYSEAQLEKLEKTNALYRVCLDEGKTERECVQKTIELARAQGYEDMKQLIKAGKMIRTGDKVYMDWMGKSIVLFQIGEDSLEKGMTKYKETQFGDGRAMVMFKDIKDCYRAWKAGFDMPKLQLGNCPRGADKKALNNEVYATEEEIGLLKEMSAAGVDIVIHTIPEATCVSFDKVM